MKKMSWFRMYNDFLSDPKMIAIAFEDQRHFIGLLALKSDGVLDQDCGEELLNRIVSQKLWLDYASIKDVKKRLIDAQLIDENWQPLGWDKRQFKSDHDETGAERQRRYRENKKNKQKQDDSNSNALHNGEVTPPDTDTDTDTDTEEDTKKFILPDDIDPVRWGEWMKVRARKRAAKTDYAHSLLIKRLRECQRLGYTANELIDLAIERSWAAIDPEWITPKKPNLQVVNDGYGGPRI